MISDGLMFKERTVREGSRRNGLGSRVSTMMESIVDYVRGRGINWKLIQSRSKLCGGHGLHYYGGLLSVHLVYMPRDIERGSSFRCKLKTDDDYGLARPRV